MEDLQKKKCADVNSKLADDIHQSSGDYYKKFCDVTYRIKENRADDIAKILLLLVLIEQS
eukprot:1368668-Ditylum_brightwellii.AAC.1